MPSRGTTVPRWPSIVAVGAAIVVLSIAVWGYSARAGATSGRAVPRAAAPVFSEEEEREGLLGAEVSGDLSQAAEFGTPSSIAYLNARNRTLQTLRDQRLSGLPLRGAVGKPWTYLGPDNRGGRARTLVIDPRDPNVMYTAGVTGGIWKTTDGGQLWKPLTDTLSNIAVDSLEFDPANPDVIYAGTGEVAVASGKRYRGLGIMRSTDAGGSWEFIPSTLNSDFFWVGDIRVSRNDSDRIYAATVTGVWRSLDGGETWTQVYETVENAQCQQLVVRSDADPETILASCGGPHANLNRVVRSDDGGDTWEQVLPRGGESGYIEIAIAPSNQDVVYASVTAPAEQEFGALELLRSDEGGAAGTWKLKNRPTLAPGSPNWLGWCEYDTMDGQGWHAHTLAVDPLNENRIWVGGVDLFRSDNGGRTLDIASYWWLDRHLPASDGTAYVHADHHAVVFHPGYDGRGNQTVFFANDGGIFRSDNAAARMRNRTCIKAGGDAMTFRPQDLNPITYVSLNNGLGIAQFVGGDVADDGSFFFAGTQDNGTITTRATDGIARWREYWIGDGGFAHIDFENRYLYYSNYYFSFYRAKFGGGQQYIGSPIQDESVFYPPFEMDPNDPAILWTAGKHPWRSTNRGGTWQRVNPMPFPDSANSIAIAPSDSNVVYVGIVAVGHVYKTTNALDPSPDWTLVAEGLPQATVRALAVDPEDSDVVYAGFKAFEDVQLYKTTDGGTSWSPTDAGFGDVPLTTLVINPQNTQMVYAGTEAGIYESLDGGASWRPLHENFAATAIGELVFRPGTTELYAFTYGRGLYRIDVGTG